MLKRMYFFAAIVVIASSCPAQEPAPRTFDVATIRPSAPGAVGGGIKALPGGHGYTAQNVPVRLMISLMYKVPVRQIKGGPAWLDSERFVVVARVDGTYNLDDLHTMYQNLLADRLGLRFHKETKEGPVYALTVASSSSKLIPNNSPQDFKIPVTGTPDHVVGTRVSMPYFCWYLGQVLQNDERPVLDKTSLAGNYDFALSFAPPVAAATSELPSIFTALKEQLGLQLQPQRGPVEYYVIDAIERPSVD